MQNLRGWLEQCQGQLTSEGTGVTEGSYTIFLGYSPPCASPESQRKPEKLCFSYKASGVQGPERGTSGDRRMRPEVLSPVLSFWFQVPDGAGSARNPYFGGKPGLRRGHRKSSFSLSFLLMEISFLVTFS